MKFWAILLLIESLIKLKGFSNMSEDYYEEKVKQFNVPINPRILKIIVISSLVLDVGLGLICGSYILLTLW